ncbi:MAG TPA: response regulator transcription factor [Actinomycetota bacterium]
MVRVLVVDPQPLFAQALTSALRQPCLVVGWTTDELEAVELVGKLRPDVILTELQLADGSGLSLARRLAGSTPVVVLTRLTEGDILLDVAAAGASGCLSHEIGVRRLGEILSRSDPARFAFDADRLGPALVRAAERRARELEGAPGVLAPLSAREREVLELLAQGLDNEAIGRRLYLSAHTVRTHVRNLRRKLNVHSRAEAARRYLESADAAPEAVLHIRGPELKRG